MNHAQKEYKLIWTLEYVDIFMTITQAAKKMRRHMKIDEVEARTMQIEDLQEKCDKCI